MSGEIPLYRRLRAAVAEWVTLSDAEWLELAAIFRARSARAQQYLSRPGEAPHELIFLGEGLLRFYYIDDDGTETNKAFITESTFAGSLAAFALDPLVLYGVQALEPSTMLVARCTDLVALYDRGPVFDRFGRRLAEWLLVRKELRARAFLQQDARERYLEFVRTHPDLVQRVPQYHIASYLGITEVTLSRLKRTLLVSRAS